MKQQIKSKKETFAHDSTQVLPLPLDVAQDDRLTLLDDFIQRQGLVGDLSPFAKDMSNRQYYRLQAGTQSFVVMDAPFPEKPTQFVLMADYLAKQGVRAPKILGFDEENGFVLLEDFGY